jgi:short subunit dehydrogenase-like uncharacterized protein
MEASLSYTASIYNSYRKGRLSVKMEASFVLYSFYIKVIQRRRTLSEWMPLFFLYSFCIQPI